MRKATMLADGMTRHKTLHKRRMLVGHFIENSNFGVLSSPVYLEMEIRETDDTNTKLYRNEKHVETGLIHWTVDHKPVMKYTEISICGTSKNSAGQMQDALRKDDGFFKATDRRKLDLILAIWDVWHLNGLIPNCIHQTAFDCNKDWDRRSAEETAKCPEGYEYGSKWLVKPLPDKVVLEILSLFNDKVLR